MSMGGGINVVVEALGKDHVHFSKKQQWRGTNLTRTISVGNVESFTKVRVET